MSGEIFTSSTNRSSRVAETGVKGSYCAKKKSSKESVMVTNIKIIQTYNAGLVMHYSEDKIGHVNENRN